MFENNSNYENVKFIVHNSKENSSYFFFLEIPNRYFDYYNRNRMYIVYYIQQILILDSVSKFKNLNP